MRIKYGNKKTIVNGIKFDSKKEAARYGVLKMLDRVGRIKDLRLQVVYPIVINGILVCKYVADYTYKENGKEVVEDCKGMKTRIYSLKRKLMKAVYNVEIKET